MATTTAPGTPNSASIFLSTGASACMWRRPLGHAVARDHATGEFLEGLLEHALALVGGEHRLVERQAVERAETFGETPLGGGVLLEVGEEGVEAARRVTRGAERGSAENGAEQSCGEHSNQSHCGLAS